MMGLDPTQIRIRILIRRHYFNSANLVLQFEANITYIVIFAKLKPQRHRFDGLLETGKLICNCKFVGVLRHYSEVLKVWKFKKYAII